MSWLSPGGGLLKSLENVLEKVDTTAATTLGKKDGGTTKPSGNQMSIPSQREKKSGTSQMTRNSSSSDFKPVSDDDLFDFLNAPIKEAKEKRAIQKKNTSTSLSNNPPNASTNASGPDSAVIATPLSSNRNLNANSSNNLKQNEVNIKNRLKIEIPLSSEPKQDSIDAKPATKKEEDIPSPSTTNQTTEGIVEEIKEPKESKIENKAEDTIIETTESTTEIKEKSSRDDKINEEIPESNLKSEETTQTTQITQIPQISHVDEETKVTNPTSPSKNINYTEEYENLLNQNSDLQLENKLLRSKIISINQELTSLAGRLKSTQQEQENLSFSLQDSKKLILEKDKQISKMKKIEEEFDVTITTKNNQLASLQVKLEESYQDIKAREEKLIQNQEKYEKLLSERETIISTHIKTENIMKERIRELEKSITEEKQNDMNTKQLHLERETSLENNISELTKALAIAQRSFEEKSTELGKLSSQFKETLEANRNLKQELADYKLRATKVLSEKENSLKLLQTQLSQNSSTNEIKSNNLDPNQLQFEKENLKKEVEEKKSTIDELQKSIMDLLQENDNFKEQTEGYSNQLKELEDILEKERKKYAALQLQSLNYNNELMGIKDDYEKQISTFSSQLKSREEEISKLKRQLQAKSISSSANTHEELENRLQTITDHLIQKQTQLENAMSEKAYVQLQLENLLHQQQQQKTEKLENQKDYDIYIDEEEFPKRSFRSRAKSDDPGPRLRSIASLVETDTVTNNPNVITRRVIGAARLLDSFSTITGRYLRQNPLIRLLAILYVFVLHLWVFYIFMSSCIPEIHTDLTFTANSNIKT